MHVFCSRWRKRELLSSYFDLVFTNRNVGIPAASCGKQKEIAAPETQNWQKQDQEIHILLRNSLILQCPINSILTTFAISWWSGQGFTDYHSDTLENWWGTSWLEESRCCLSLKKYSKRIQQSIDYSDINNSKDSRGHPKDNGFYIQKYKWTEISMNLSRTNITRLILSIFLLTSLTHSEMWYIFILARYLTKYLMAFWLIG